jgi:hypothetical protein
LVEDMTHRYQRDAWTKEDAMKLWK